MKKTFLEAIKNRRSFYALQATSPITDEELEKLISSVITCLPSAFNSQSPRVVLLLGKEHVKLWNIVLDTLRKTVPEENFAATQTKIEGSFMSGYGTLLFFEDSETTKNYQEQFAFYADNFPIWAQQSNGIAQFALWTALEDAGMGASLQHYNPIIDEQVKAEWDLPKSWNLLAQMPFGTPAAKPNEKTHLPIEQRLFIKK